SGSLAPGIASTGAPCSLQRRAERTETRALMPEDLATTGQCESGDALDFSLLLCWNAALQLLKPVQHHVDLRRRLSCRFDMLEHQEALAVERDSIVWSGRGRQQVWPFK